MILQLPNRLGRLSSIRSTISIRLWFPPFAPTPPSRASRPVALLLRGVVILLLAAPMATAMNPALETGLAPEERAKLDTFEGVSIDKADKVFTAKDWPRAVAEYDAFLVQFPESKITPYAILRKGRSFQEVEKRFEAIKVYQEVLDFFPDDVKYASAALFRIGECHAQNGDVEKAIKAWAELADDEEYVKQPLGAFALNALADNLIRQGKADEGIKRFEQVAVAFRGSNGDAVWNAIERVVPYHVRSKPDAARLRAFYEAAKSFDRGPRKIGDDVATDATYWREVREAIKKHGTFTDVQRAEHDGYYRYWADQMAGKLPTDDEFQIDRIAFIRAHERDEAAWMKRLDEQFATHQKDGDFGRVARWIGAYATQPAKVDEYLRKLDFAKMKNPEIFAVVQQLVANGGDPALTVNTFEKLRFAEMDDKAKEAICGWLTAHPQSQAPVGRTLFLQTCRAFTNQEAGKLRALRYLPGACHGGHHRNPQDIGDGLAIAVDLQKVPATAKEAYTIGGNFLQWSGKYDDAIKAYQQADSPPQTLFWTAECLAKLGKLEPAMGQLREVENFFKDNASEAALKIAYLYRDGGVKNKYVTGLRGVLKKYPKSPQSSEAHQRLEEMGLPIGGGVNAEE